MIQHGDAARPRIELLPALREEEPIMANLVQLYAHDFTEFCNLQIGEDGRFCYRALPLYWSDPNRHPFFVRIDSSLAGLVLVRKGSQVSANDSVWDMAEFFILRGQRRRGIGTHVAHEVWRRLPGPWEVRVMEANISAQHFWARAISTFASEEICPIRIEKDGEFWLLFSFEAKSSNQ